LSRIDGKQQQNDRKFCEKDLGVKCSYLGLVSIFGNFSCLGSCTFVLSVFEPYWWETTKKCPKIMCEWFGCKKKSSCIGF